MMRLLLDTHTFLWFVQDDPSLSARAKALIKDENNEKFVSMACTWEIAIKTGIEKLVLGEPFAVFIPREIAVNHFTVQPITLDHTAIVAALPHHHRDPFDRLLAARALVEGMPILSADCSFDASGIPGSGKA
jgi:PIN domain nuclease of toxin-antitoxin system